MLILLMLIPLTDKVLKGYGVGANYTVAKNMVLTAAYYDTKSKFDTSDKDKIMWTDLTITF